MRIEESKFDILIAKIKNSIIQNAFLVYDLISGNKELEALSVTKDKGTKFVFDLSIFLEIIIDCSQVLIMLDILIRRYKLAADTDLVQSSFEFSHSIKEYISFLNSFFEMDMNVADFNQLFHGYIGILLDFTKIFSFLKQFFQYDQTNVEKLHEFVDLVTSKLWLSAVPIKETNLSPRYLDLVRYVNNLLFNVDDPTFISRLNLSVACMGYRCFFNLSLITREKISTKDMLMKIWNKYLERLCSASIELLEVSKKEKIQGLISELLGLGQKLNPLYKLEAKNENHRYNCEQVLKILRDSNSVDSNPHRILQSLTTQVEDILRTSKFYALTVSSISMDAKIDQDVGKLENELKMILEKFQSTSDNLEVLSTKVVQEIQGILASKITSVQNLMDLVAQISKNSNGLLSLVKQIEFSASKKEACIAFLKKFKSTIEAIKFKAKKTPFQAGEMPLILEPRIAYYDSSSSAVNILVFKDFGELVKSELENTCALINSPMLPDLFQRFRTDFIDYVEYFKQVENVFFADLNKVQRDFIDFLDQKQKEFRSGIISFLNKFIGFIEQKQDILFKVPTIDSILESFRKKDLQFWNLKDKTIDYENWYEICNASILQDSNEDILLESEADDHSRIKGGSLQGLVRRLVYYKFFDAEFQEIFLTLYFTFTNNATLLNNLFELFNSCHPQKSLSLSVKQLEYYYVRKVTVIRTRILRFLQVWLESHCDWSTIDFCQTFLDTNVQQYDPEMYDVLKKEIQQIREKVLTEVSKKIDDFVLSPVSPIDSNDLLSVNPVDFAHSYTMLDYENFCQIKISECIGQRWNKESTKHLAPNITAMIGNSAAMTFFIASQILSRNSAIERAAMISFFVEVAHTCYQIKNFNAVFAVMSGLTCTPIFRLKTTWDLFRNEKKFKKIASFFSDPLERIVDSVGNFSAYRSMMKVTSSPPCLPFLGMYLTDLTFIDQGNLDTISAKSFINFEKQRKIFYLFQELKKFQDTSTGYHYKVAPVASAIFSKSGAMDEDQLYDLSIRIEPKSSG